MGGMYVSAGLIERKSLTPFLPFHQVGKIIGQKWREMPDEDKQPFFEEYEAEKAIYTEQLKAYRNSPAYKRWLEVKQQGL